ncbi:MAG: hypothetical protein U0840_10660 [Gemmataceae bacterium]
MAKRGQCRCGHILIFELTSQGYKTRCPVCRSIVRLRGDAPAQPVALSEPRPRTPQPALAPALPAPTDFHAEEIPVLEEVPTLEELPEPPPRARPEPPPLARPRARFDREAVDDVEPPPARGLLSWILAGIILLVLAAIGGAVVLWS